MTQAPTGASQQFASNSALAAVDLQKVYFCQTGELRLVGDDINSLHLLACIIDTSTAVRKYLYREAPAGAR
jgi:hypothetical protein